MSRSRLRALRDKVRAPRPDPPKHRVKGEGDGRYRVDVKLGSRYVEWGVVERDGSRWCTRIIGKDGLKSRKHGSKREGVEALMNAHPDGRGYDRDEPIPQPAPEPDQVEETEPEPEDEPRSERKVSTPVLLACGHFDWDYNPETDECGLCRKKTHAYTRNRVHGILIQLVHDVERLSNESQAVLLEGMSPESDPDMRLGCSRVRDRIFRLKELAEKGSALTGTHETFLQYPGHLRIREEPIVGPKVGPGEEEHG